MFYHFQSNDLQGVKAYFNLDPDGLYTLGTVVVDYRGYRVTAQSIIPGEFTCCNYDLHVDLGVCDVMCPVQNVVPLSVSLSAVWS